MGELRRTRIRSRSARRVRVAEQRREIREGGPRSCEVCPILEAAGIPTRCRRRVEGLHERRKASSGGSLLNPENLMASCNWGNAWLEDYPALVRERTGDRLVVREGDETWDALGRRHDRFR